MAFVFGECGDGAGFLVSGDVTGEEAEGRDFVEQAEASSRCDGDRVSG